MPRASECARRVTGAGTHNTVKLGRPEKEQTASRSSTTDCLVFPRASVWSARMHTTPFSLHRQVLAYVVHPQH